MDMAVHQRGQKGAIGEIKITGYRRPAAGQGLDGAEAPIADLQPQAAPGRLAAAVDQPSGNQLTRGAGCRLFIV